MSTEFFSHFRTILEQIESASRANITKIAKHTKYYPTSNGGYASIEFRDYNNRPIVSIPIKDTDKTVDIAKIYLGGNLISLGSPMITIETSNIKYLKEYRNEIISEVRKRFSSIGFSDAALSDIELDETSLSFDTTVNYLYTSKQFNEEFLKAAHYKQSQEEMRDDN